MTRPCSFKHRAGQCAAECVICGQKWEDIFPPPCSFMSMPELQRRVADEPEGVLARFLPELVGAGVMTALQLGTTLIPTLCYRYVTGTSLPMLILGSTIAGLLFCLFARVPRVTWSGFATGIANALTMLWAFGT